ncbi:hypothetical protein ACN47E_008699 [Coniothyrium glycines]
MLDHILPSIAEIRQSTHFLSAPDATATVVKVGPFAVKFGPSVTLLEAENLKYVSTSSEVPVPEVFGTLVEPETGIRFIIMEFVPGPTLEKIWTSLHPLEKLDISNQLRTALVHLRQLRPEQPGYLGSVGQQALADGVFWKPGYDPAISGPFKNEAELNEGIIRKLAESESTSYMSLFRSLVSATLQGHQTAFTHGDLQAKNIIVHRTGTKGDGSGTGTFDVRIIDWEISGWYPEYWEFCNATIIGRFRPEWLELVQQIMPTYPREYLMMQTIRGIMFC